MKQLKFLTIALLGAAAVNLASCNNDDAVYYGPVYATTTLKAVNLKKSPFGTKEVRALANISYANADAGEYDKSVFINWIDSILTKNTAPDLNEENIAAYGNDPVEIVKDWVTIAEDGYLTLRFRSRWDPYLNKSHLVNLVASSDPSNPYEVTFYHNAFGDVNGVFGDGIVAFNLAQLPDTQGKVVDLTLKWNSFSGEKSAKFKYCSRKAGGNGTSVMVEGLEVRSERFADMVE